MLSEIDDVSKNEKDEISCFVREESLFFLPDFEHQQLVKKPSVRICRLRLRMVFSQASRMRCCARERPAKSMGEPKNNSSDSAESHPQMAVIFWGCNPHPQVEDAE